MHIVLADFEDDGGNNRVSNASNCSDIARQLVEFPANHLGSDGLEVALGGGRRSYLPRTLMDPNMKLAAKDRMNAT